MTVPQDGSFDDLRRAVGRVLAADRRLRGQQQHRGGGGQRGGSQLSLSHVRALLVLTTQPEATAGTLAKEAQLNPASVTAMVDQLEDRGLVQRRRDDHDRRQCWISLTAAGRRAVEEKEREWRSQMAETLADITPKELTAATKVLERIATVMEHLGKTELESDTPG